MTEAQLNRANEIVKLQKEAYNVLSQFIENNWTVSISKTVLEDMYPKKGFKELVEGYIDDLDEEFKKL